MTQQSGGNHDCPLCENRRVLPIGDQERTIACPACNGWCAYCVAGVQAGRQSWTQRGVLLAGAQRTSAGDVLFEGYACDIHRARLRSYSFTGPLMIGRCQLGEAFIATQWGCVFVMGYGYGPATNWQELEAAARQYISAQRRPHYGGWGQDIQLYTCPADLAARVVGAWRPTAAATTEAME